jgi:hypothetical protein
LAAGLADGLADGLAAGASACAAGGLTLLLAAGLATRLTGLSDDGSAAGVTRLAAARTLVTALAAAFGLGAAVCFAALAGAVIDFFANVFRIAIVAQGHRCRKRTGDRSKPFSLTLFAFLFIFRT